MNNNNQKSQALELKQQGLSYQQIADELGIGKTTAYNYCNEVSGGNETPKSSHPSLDNETLIELKATLADLRDELVQGESNVEISQLVELRKLELEHEYRMEELENNRRERLKRAEIESLQKKLADTGTEASVGQRIQELSEQLSNLQNNILALQERRAEEGQMEFSDKSSNITHVDDPPGMPSHLVARLRSVLKEYLEHDWTNCEREWIEAIDERVHDLQYDMEEWAEDSDFDHHDEQSFEILAALLSDIEETLGLFDEEDEPVLDLIQDDGWRAEMEEWLEQIE